VSTAAAATARALTMAAKRRRSAATRDIIRAPDVRVARGEVELEDRAVSDPATGRMTGVTRGDRVTGQLLRLYRNAAIGMSEPQYRAGARYADLVEAATVSIRSMLDRDPRGSGDPPIVTDAAWRRARASIDLQAARRAVGPVLLPVLDWVAVTNLPPAEWAVSVGKPERHGLAALLLALDGLVEHWRDRRDSRDGRKL